MCSNRICLCAPDAGSAFDVIYFMDLFPCSSCDVGEKEDFSDFFSVIRSLTCFAAGRERSSRSSGSDEGIRHQ